VDPDLARASDSPPGGVPDPSPGRRRAPPRAAAVGVVLLALAAAGLWAVWRRPDPEPAPAAPTANRPPDPRLTYTGPFRNIAPDVAYVGDEQCAQCHLDKELSYRQHPMGRSLFPIGQVAAQQRYDASAHNPFEALGALFLVERRGERVLHRQVGRDAEGQPVYEADTPIDYVLGSGTHGCSYLSDRGGYVFQSPVSWFSEKQIWDKSPGFGVGGRAGRPIPALCLYCHANRVRPVEGSVNRYEEPLFDGHAIGCERCHGPGGRHVQDPGRKEGGVDYTIVNPRHLEPGPRAGVCEQCHLTGVQRVLHRGRGLNDFRPGLPLEAFWSIYVHAADPDEPQQAVSQVEQMCQSRCFVGSKENPAQGRRKLGCTSCHDPHQHVGPEQRVAHYRQRCLECHRQHGCTLSEATRRRQVADDSCIACHMPRYPPADIAHASATDHRIVRHAAVASLPPGQRRSEAGRRRREPALVPFHRPPDRREAERDLGIALTNDLVQGLIQGKAPPPEARWAVGLLEASVRHDPEDLPAWEAKARVLTLADRKAEALAAYEAVLAKAPHREVSLAGAAMLARDLQQVEAALSYGRRAVAENPWQPKYHADLAQLLADRKAWDEARPHCEAWVRLDPGSIEARMLWVRCLLQNGDKDRARAEFAKIERLRPANLPLLQARFAVEARAR
jgi:Flp pilus assembly protein TadD